MSPDALYELTERWFGQSWGAACCDPADHAATPIGRPCTRCKEPILATDQGLIHPHLHWVEGGVGGYTLEPVHLACFLREIRPHGPECPHCRGVEPRDHDPACRRQETGLCSCIPMPEGAR